MHPPTPSELSANNTALSVASPAALARTAGTPFPKKFTPGESALSDYERDIGRRVTRASITAVSLSVARPLLQTIPV